MIETFKTYKDLYKIDIRDYSVNDRGVMFELYLQLLLSEQRDKMIALLNRQLCLFEIQIELAKSDSEFNKMESFKFFEEYKKSYFEENLDKIYVDMYSSFEIYIYNLIHSLFWLFPEILTGKNDEKVNVSIFELQYYDDYLSTRRAIIDKKITEYVYLPMDSLVSKLKNIFGIKINLSKDEINKLIVISNIRHLIVHNDSEINDIFKSRLINKGISLEFIKSQGTVSPIVKKQIENDRKFLNELSEKIEKAIYKDIKTIIKRVEAIKK